MKCPVRLQYLAGTIPLAATTDRDSCILHSAMQSDRVTCGLCQFTCGVPTTFVRPVEFPACPTKSGSDSPERAPTASITDVLVLLYYSYVEIVDIQSALTWHRAICSHLNLYGRVRVAPEGVNVVSVEEARPRAGKLFFLCLHTYAPPP